MNIHIIGNIGSKCSFFDQMELKKVCIDFNKIIEIRTIPIGLHKKIDDKIIKNYLYLEGLDLSNNDKITDYGIKNLSKLQSLNMGNNGVITDDGIKNLSNITYLNLWENHIHMNIISINIKKSHQMIYIMLQMKYLISTK